MAKRSAYLTQFEAPVVPSNWSSEERRYAQRVNQIFEQLFARKAVATAAASGECPFPISFVMMLMGDTNPGDVCGGVWERIAEGRVPLAAGDRYKAGSVGGSETVALTEDNLPALEGSITAMANGEAWGMFSGASGVFTRGALDIPSATAAGASSTNQRAKSISFQAGANEPHDNMQPWIAINMWQRIA